MMMLVLKSLRDEHLNILLQFVQKTYD